MLSGGLRIREVLGIRKRDIETDFERYLIHVNPNYAKGKKISQKKSIIYPHVP